MVNREVTLSPAAMFTAGVEVGLTVSSAAGEESVSCAAFRGAWPALRTVAVKLVEVPGSMTKSLLDTDSTGEGATMVRGKKLTAGVVQPVH